MKAAVQDALLDAALPGWSLARLVSGQREVQCPSGTHKDRHPSFHVDPEKRVGICRACGFGGGAYEIAKQVLGEERAREIIRSFDDGTMRANGSRGSRRIDDREPTKVETLGPVMDAQRAALARTRRIRDEKTIESMGIDHVRAWDAEWIRIPALAVAKLWAVNADGRARRDKRGKLTRHNVGPGSLVCSPALREGQ
jgi:hypothetical protein